MKIVKLIYQARLALSSARLALSLMVATCIVLPTLLFSAVSTNPSSLFETGSSSQVEKSSSAKAGPVNRQLNWQQAEEKLVAEDFYNIDQLDERFNRSLDSDEKPLNRGVHIDKVAPQQIVREGNLPESSKIEGGINRQANTLKITVGQRQVLLPSEVRQLSSLSSSGTQPNQDSFYDNLISSQDTTIAQLTAPPPDKKGEELSPITINFNNISMAEYVRFVSQLAKKNFIYDENDLQFYVSIVSEEPSTIDDILTALLQVLRVHDLMLIEDGDNYIIHKNPAARSLSEVVVENWDETSAVEGNPEIITQVLALNTLQATQAESVVNGLISGQGLVESFQETNHIVITDLRNNVEKIVKILRSADAPANGLTIGQYVVRNGDINAVMELAATIMKPFTKDLPFTMAAQEESGSIYIVSTPFIMERIIPILNRIDQRNGITGVFNLDNVQFMDYGNWRSSLGASNAEGAATKNKARAASKAAGSTGAGAAAGGGYGGYGGFEGLGSSGAAGQWQLDNQGRWFFLPNLPSGTPGSISNPFIPGLYGRTSSPAAAGNLPPYYTVDGLRRFQAASPQAAAAAGQGVGLPPGVAGSSAGALGQPGLAPGQSGAPLPSGSQPPFGPPGITLPGEAGATGAAGSSAVGLPGAAGQPGFIGPQGQPGQTIQGQPGAAGSNTASGATLAPGQSAEPGATGEAGLPGATGLPGQPGFAGEAGQAGTAGVSPPGSAGAPGSTGVPGSTGFPGSAGAPGQAGAAGSIGGSQPFTPVSSATGLPNQPGVPGQNLSTGPGAQIPGIPGSTLPGQVVGPTALPNIPLDLSTPLKAPVGAWVVDPQGNWFFEPGEEAVRRASATDAFGAPLSPEEQRRRAEGMVGPRGRWVVNNEGLWVFQLDPGDTIFSGQTTRFSKVNNGLSAGHVENTKFYLHKLQFRKAVNVEDAIRKVGLSLIDTDSVNTGFLATLNSVQSIEDTNSLIISGPPEEIAKVIELIQEIDTPLRQVFIEMLILETTVVDSLNYGVNWASRFGGGSTAGAQAFIAGASPINQGISTTGVVYNGNNGVAAVLTPDATGLAGNQPGYALGIVGQHIINKCFGTEFNSIAALVQALHERNTGNVLLNPKILTEDGVPAEIFVGINTRYRGQSISNDLGSVITSNFEYRDVGTRLTVTPTLGPSKLITLEIDQEVSRVLTTTGSSGGSSELSDQGAGPTTSKSSTKTKVHVPDGFFLIISGMINDEESRDRSQIPCLGGAPLLGGLFSFKRDQDTKRNLMVFIRPKLIDTDEEYRNLTRHQQDVWKIKCNSRSNLCSARPSWKYEVEGALDFFNLQDHVECGRTNLFQSKEWYDAEYNKPLKGKEERQPVHAMERQNAMPGRRQEGYGICDVPNRPSRPTPSTRRTKH